MTAHLTPDQSNEDLALAESISKHAQPPAEVQGYQPERWLGQGAFGAVWVATDRNTGRRVAIKFFTRRGGLDWSLLSREVEKLRFLSNDRYVVQLLEVGWNSTPPYYVMEYVEGGSLEDRLRSGPMSTPEAVALFREVVLGLSHAHNKGILHCDLKPGNILLNEDGEPRLADFGQARLPDEHSPALGTWFYMAPEQADLKAAPDARWDVYALGAVFHCMLTGTPPFRDEEVSRQIGQAKGLEERLNRYRKHIMESPRPSAHRRMPGVDRALADIVDRCLAQMPSKRYPNVQAVLDALDTRALNRARRPLLVLGALGPILLLLVMFVVAWLMIAESVNETKKQIVGGVQSSNHVMAELAAKRVGDRIRQRRLLLEEEARNPQLAALIKAAADQPLGGPAQEALQKYIDARRQNYQYMDIDNNWFLTDNQGRLLDVSPPEARQRAEKNLGKFFWYRDFFHGNNTDYPQQREQPRPPHLKPIKEFYQSLVFRSSQEGSPFMMAFSAPVKDPGTDNIVGVLSMSLRLGSFSELHARERDDAAETPPVQWITLVQAREEQRLPESSPDLVANRGLILEHPEMRRIAGRPGEKLPLVHIDPAVLGALQVHHEVLDYHDPFAALAPEFAARYVTAAEPIVYQLRSPDGRLKTEQTGLMVVVQANYDKAIEPVEALRRRLMLRGLLGLTVLIAVVVALWVFVGIGLNDSSRSRLAAFLRRRAGLSSISFSATARTRSGGSVHSSRIPTGSTATLSLAPGSQPDIGKPK